MDQKDLLTAIEEKVEVAKKNWASEVEKKGSEFESKLEKAIAKLQEESKDFDSKNGAKFEDFKKAIEKDFDSLSATLTDKAKDNSNQISFKDAVTKGVGNQLDEIKGNARARRETIIDLKSMGFENFTNYDTFTQDIRNTVIPTMEEAFHVRQILSSGTTTGATLYYPKATGKTGAGPAGWDYNKTTVASTVVKPAFAMNFERMSAPVEWIAGILTLPIEMLEDLSWLTSYLATYAPIELLKEEDDQILNGDGTGNTLNGLINTADAYSGTYGVGIERIIDAAYGQLGESNFDMPTNVLLNPRDIVAIMLNKASTSGEYNLPEGAVGIVGGRLQIGGLTVNKTNKISQGNFLVGDFIRGAALVTRSAMQLRFFDQNKDNVEKNMMTIRIEERVALPKFYEDAFIYGALTSS
jgi:HK97 family phage major capsid protein